MLSAYLFILHRILLQISNTETLKQMKIKLYGSSMKSLSLMNIRASDSIDLIINQVLSIVWKCPVLEELEMTGYDIHYYDMRIVED